MKASFTRRYVAIVTAALFGVVALALPHLSGLAQAPPEPGAGPFASGEVLAVHITLSAEEYAAIEPRTRPGFGPAPKEPEKAADPKRDVHRNDFGADLPWGVGTVVVGDQVFDKVGVRYKGNGTIFDTARSIKKSFKIDLDREGGKGRFGGSKTINLHCGVTDPTKCRETLGYELYRAAGVPASRTALAEVRITVPGRYDKQLLGLYTVVEDVGKPFLKDRFGTDQGLLMKPEQLRDFKDLGDDWGRYKKNYAPSRDATADESARIISFTRLVDKADDATFAKEIGSYLDLDNYLRFLAATAFVANTDSFFTIGHNYYLYLHPQTGKLHFIPWDLDRAFANFGNGKQNMDLSLTHPYAGSHCLTERLLAIPAVGERYQKLLKELATGPFEKGRLLKRLAGLEEIIQGPRDRDAKAAADRRERPGGSPFGAPPALADFFEARAGSVAAQLEGKSKGFIPRGGFPFPGGPGGAPPPGR